MNDEDKYTAVVECVCGRSYTCELGGAETECKCGAKVSLRYTSRGDAQAWVNTPHDYDLSSRKLNRPKVTKWL